MVNKELRGKMKAAQQAVEQEEKKIADLTARHKSSSQRQGSLQDELQNAEKVKVETINRFVVAEASQEDVDFARGACDRARKKLQEETEIGSATAHALEEAKNRLQLPGGLKDRLISLEREFWTAVFDELKADLAPVRQKIELAFCAREMTGLNVRWEEPFFKDLFGRDPDRDVLIKAEAQLKSKYL